MELHESIRHTRKEMTIKESAGFRLRLVKHDVISPAGLKSIDFINESLKEDGSVAYSSTYNFFMTEDELKSLAYGLVA